MPRFFVIAQGRKLGPFTADELGRLAADKALPPDALLEEEFTGSFSSPAIPATEAAAGAIPRSPGEPRSVLPTVPILIWTALIAALGLYLLFTRPQWFVLDWLNLPMHEAGHTVFILFGQFLYVLGGTVMQLAVPSLVAAYFRRQHQVAGVQFGLFWLGESCLNVGTYAGDARAMALPLLGGGDGHDWHYLLDRLGLLSADRAVAALFAGMGALAFAAAVVWPFLHAGRRGP